MSMTDKERCLLDICNKYHLTGNFFKKTRLLFRTPLWLKVVKSIDHRVPILITFINFSSEGDHHEIHFSSNIDWTNDATKDEKIFLTSCFKQWSRDYCRTIHPLESKNIVRFDVLPSIFDRHIRKFMLYKAFAIKINNNYYDRDLGSNLNPLAILESKSDCFEQWKTIPEINQIMDEIHSGMNNHIIQLNNKTPIISQVLDILNEVKGERYGRSEFIQKIMSLYEPMSYNTYHTVDKFDINEEENKVLNSRIVPTRKICGLLTSIVQFWIRISKIRKLIIKRMTFILRGVRIIIRFRNTQIYRTIMEKERCKKEEKKI